MKSVRTVLAMLITVSMVYALPVCAQQTKPTTKPTTKPAAKSTAKPAAKTTPSASTKPAVFDQQKVLKKFYEGPGTAVVGTVGNIKVTKDELMETLWNYGAPAVLSSLLSQKMIEDAVKKEGITVTKAELDAKAKQTAQAYGYNTIEELANARRLSSVMLMNDIRMNMLLEKLGRKKAKATDDEIAQYVLVRHILVRFPNVKDEPDEAKRKAIAKQKIDEIAAKVKAGGDFAELAKQYSDDSTKTNGGLLDWATRGSWVKEFEDAVFALQPGQVSEPVESMFGYHIIKLEKTGKEATPQEKEKIREMIVSRKLQGVIQDWIQKLNASTKINNMLIDNTPPPQPKPAARPQTQEQAPPDVPDLPPSPPIQ